MNENQNVLWPCFNSELKKNFHLSYLYVFIFFLFIGPKGFGHNANAFFRCFVRYLKLSFSIKRKVLLNPSYDLL